MKGHWFEGGLSWQLRIGWFRLFGYGLGLMDHRLNPPALSERYNGLYGFRKRHYWHIGPWCLKMLTP